MPLPQKPSTTIRKIAQNFASVSSELFFMIGVVGGLKMYHAHKGLLAGNIVFPLVNCTFLIVTKIVWLLKYIELKFTKNSCTIQIKIQHKLNITFFLTTCR